MENSVASVHFLTFVRKWDFTESLPSLALSLKAFSHCLCFCYFLRAMHFKVETDKAFL